MTTHGIRLDSTPARINAPSRCVLCLLLAVLTTFPLSADVAKKGNSRAAEDRPNIVFILMDNLGFGEPGCYGGGILRGAATPRIDRLAAEGMRLLNFNVETKCTPSRSAIMTGRYSIRSGTVKVPRGGGLNGLTQWEITLAELLSDQGYATGHFGKWHLGNSEGRLPTNQGFDEWYGIPNTSNESMWTVRTGYDPEVAPESYILEGRKGETTRKVEIFDLESRRKIDTESTRRTVEFIKRNAKAGRPFYAYVPLTQVHFPILPHPDFAGLTGNGDFADSLAEMDHHVGTMVDAVDELGIGENTIFIFTSDNGPEEALPWRGSAGPWTGSYFTAMEGSLRVPFIVRWPGQIPAGNVNDKIVHAVDTFTTLANMAGATLPSDRMIDGVDQTDFFLGRQEASNREGFPVYVSDTLYAVKWRNWKAHFVEHKYKFDPPLKLPTIRIHDLYRDPHERNNIQTPNSWVIYPLKKIAREMEESLVIEPPIPPGTPDPYLPPTPSRR